MTARDQGPEYEADQRHAEILTKDVCVDESSKGVATPDVSAREGGQGCEGEGRKLGGESILRALAARGNY